MTIKYLKLESYEDALNNIQLRSYSLHQDIFDILVEDVKSEFALKYIFENELFYSLLNTDNFKTI